MTLTKLSPDSYGGGSPTVWRRDPVTMLVQGWEEDATFAAWRERGCIPDTGDPLIADWTGMVRARIEGGAVMRRVHVVSYPMTEYVRFELAMQRAHSLPVGERVVEADRHPDLARAEDFWLLDDRVGVRLIYGDGGRLIRLERMNTGEVDTARCVRDAAWTAGTDLAGIEAVAVS
ncbi:MAG: DUF6879 family protein [Pseudonocardiaceae bacterium]